MQNRNSKKQQLILKKNVASAYYSVQFLQEKQLYFQRLDSLYSRLNSIAGTQLSLGDISQLDKLNAQAKKQQISLEISKMSIEIQNEYSNLKAMMQTDEDFRIANEGMKMVVVNKPEFQNSPEIKQYQLRSEYLKISSKAEQHRLLPDISLEYFYGTIVMKIPVVITGFRWVWVFLFTGTINVRKSEQVGLPLMPMNCFCKTG